MELHGKSMHYGLVIARYRGLSHKMESALKCEVCMVAYNSNEHRPRFLPCGHSMCSSCIKETLRTCKSKLTCPFCRNRCGTGINVMDDFPTAFELLNLLEKPKPNTSSGALSLIDKENKEYLEMKQAEYDCSESHRSNCNDHLSKLHQAKELQQDLIKSIEIEQKKLEEEQKKLEEDKKKIISRRDELCVIMVEGFAIMTSIDEFQDRVKCSTNLTSLKETNEDGQRCYTASKEWIISTANDIIIEDTNVTKNTEISGQGDSSVLLSNQAKSSSGKGSAILFSNQAKSSYGQHNAVFLSNQAISASSGQRGAYCASCHMCHAGNATNWGEGCMFS